ncbi:MAG TPA: anthranilate phosphoribosyltransferase [Phycisphaerales bacterium]|nr:anthranilate phosphoribosyltransferase [Phycisphaerales bacterium]HMP38646.1 anthranilate phosphoribosyltransferase [Phycisphaerales bacterium]
MTARGAGADGASEASAPHQGVAAAPIVGPPEFVRGAPGFDLTPQLAVLLGGGTLDERTSAEAFEAIMTGATSQAEIAAFLALLAARGPTLDELVGAARVMRRHVQRVPTTIAPERLLDTAGTGGAPKTFNVSTAAAIVAAAGGAVVAKHGNRSRTGRGSAEVLAALGVDVDAEGARQSRCLDAAGVCFCFAIHHHPAARHAMPVRKALGFPTIFNLLGPLTNPAGAQRQLMGVYDRRFLRLLAGALARLGARHALVVHGGDGLDELSIGAPTFVAEVRDGAVREYELDPARLGLRRAEASSLAARDVDHAAALVRGVLSGGERGPHRDMTLLNAAAALFAAGVEPSIEAGLSAAAAAIDDGRAMATLARLIEASR